MSMTDHASGCPVGRLAALFAAEQSGPCPECRIGHVTVNRMDFYECRKCHTQFCVSEVCGGEDPATLKTALIDITGADPYYGLVYVMKNKGNGDFPIDQTAKMLQEEGKQWVKERRKDKGR